MVENARKEGSVTFYAATNLRDTQEIVAGFNKCYPFVKVGITSLGGPGVLNKVTTEERAGVALADVVTMTGCYVPELIEKKMLAKYRSPMVPFVRKGFVDAEVLAGRLRHRLHDYLQQQARVAERCAQAI